jgi:hypothetical protein
MNGSNPAVRAAIGAAVAVTALAAALEIFVRRTPDASFLVALSFFTMVVEGCVAVAATGELSKGIWLIPIKWELLRVYPLILVAAVLSLVLGAKAGVYPWSGHQSGWLNTRFFMARNFVVLLGTYLVARKLVRAIRVQSRNKNRWAGFYIAMFIVSQSLVAFDWIMTLEYPWVSTLLGGYFFIESFLMGLAVAAFVLLFRMRSPGHGLTETLRDTSKMMFGFCIMWVGFFFAQFLVIWYGNIPEEVGYVLTRVNDPPFAALSRAVLFLVWAIPFVVLLSRPLKTVPAAMAGVGGLILAGLFIEKLVLVLPVAKVSPAALAFEMILLVGLTAYFVSSRYLIAPQQVAESAPPGAPRT